MFFALRLPQQTLKVSIACHPEPGRKVVFELGAIDPTKGRETPTSGCRDWRDTTRLARPPRARGVLAGSLPTRGSPASLGWAALAVREFRCLVAGVPAPRWAVAAEARVRASELARGRMEIHAGSFDAGAFEPGSFDAALCVGSTHTIGDDAAALRELARSSRAFALLTSTAAHFFAADDNATASLPPPHPDSGRSLAGRASHLRRSGPTRGHGQRVLSRDAHSRRTGRARRGPAAT